MANLNSTLSRHAHEHHRSSAANESAPPRLQQRNYFETPSAFEQVQKQPLQSSTNSNPNLPSPAQVPKKRDSRRPSHVTSKLSIQSQPERRPSFDGSMFPSDQQPTQETLQMYRQQVKKANDPILLLEFSKYVIQMAEHLGQEKQSSPQKQKALYSEAIKYIKKICSFKTSSLNDQQKAAVAEALVFYAECHGSGGLGIAVSHEKAFSLYAQASKLNHPQATYRVAVCNELGAGCKRDSGRAVQYFRKSAALGDSAGMYKMGLVMLNGLLGQTKNPREAISWLKRAAQIADHNNPHALHELGLIYEKEGIPNVIPDDNYARDLFTQASFLGYAPSQYRLGYAYEYGALGCA